VLGVCFARLFNSLHTHLHIDFLLINDNIEAMAPKKEIMATIGFSLSHVIILFRIDGSCSIVPLGCILGIYGMILGGFIFLYNCKYTTFSWFGNKKRAAFWRLFIFAWLNRFPAEAGSLLFIQR